MKTTNIIYDISKIQIQNIFLLENKRNIIMNGKFTKIVYSDHLFMTNGIYLRVPLLLNGFSYDGSREDKPRMGFPHLLKCFLLFQANSEPNDKIMHALIRIEQCILEFYKQIFKCNKKMTTILKSQLNNGCIKIYTENNKIDDIKLPRQNVGGNSAEIIPATDQYNFTLKISGIWEDAEHIGLTYKFL